MLIGEYQHSIDAKGRLIIPSRFREEMGMRFILTRGLDGCLNAYSLVEWNKIEKNFAEMENGGKSMRNFERWFFGGAVECEIDKQGRVIIPQHLREYAKLGKDAVVLGNRSKIEIWSRENLNETASDIEECLAAAEKIPGLKI